MDIYFIVDIVMNFRTAYFDVKSGGASAFCTAFPRTVLCLYPILTCTPIGNLHVLTELILDNSMIAKHYLRGWFGVDFVSCLPVGYLTMITDATSGEGGENSGGSQLKGLKILRMLRLAKMLRVFRVKNLMRRYQETIRPILNMMRVSIQIIAIVLIAHVLGCLWYLTGTSTQTLGDGTQIHGWTSRQLGWRNCETAADATHSDVLSCSDDKMYASEATRYLTALYWAITTVSTVGYGDIVAWTDYERLFAFMSTLVGVMAFATLSGTFSSIIMSTKGAVQVRLDSSPQRCNCCVRRRH